MKIIENNTLEDKRLEITISVDAQTFETALEKVFRKEVKHINVQGFRKGKAPRKMVEKIYGESVFFEDAVNELITPTLLDAMKELDLVIVGRPEVDVTEISKADGFTYKAICTLKPDVIVGEYKGLKQAKVVKPCTTPDVDARVDALRERNARFVEVSRPTQNGDTVIFDFDGYVDGIPFEGGKAESFSLVLGSKQFIPGFEEQMEDKNVDVPFDVLVTFPENYQAEQLAGKEATFKCKISEIKGKELPDVDDEFAKDVSEFDTLEELRADLKAKIIEHNEEEATVTFENALIDTVLAGIKGDIPAVMIEERIDDLMRDFEYRLKSQGMNLEAYLEYAGMDSDAFRKTFAVQAEKQVKLRLALEKVVILENIDVNDDELEKEYEKFADMYKMEIEQVKRVVNVDDFKMDIKVNKAIDVIKNTAIVE